MAWYTTSRTTEPITATKRLYRFSPVTPEAPKVLSLVGEICGSPIRSNGCREARLAQPANQIWESVASAFLFVASCLSN
jgi:hypothetical protein